MRPEQVIFKALQQADNDRYLLALAVSKRVNQILAGDSIKVKDGSGKDFDTKKYKVSDLALLEIAEGKVNISVQ